MDIEQLEEMLESNSDLTEAQEKEVVKLIIVKWEESQPEPEPYLEELVVLPKTLDEAISMIIADMSTEDKDVIKETNRSDLVRFHHGWGTGIRNSFSLWGGNNELILSICSSLCHPDDASMKIIEAVWDKLHNKQINKD